MSEKSDYFIPADSEVPRDLGGGLSEMAINNQS
jgi:hypothetical protein